MKEESAVEKLDRMLQEAIAAGTLTPQAMAWVNEARTRAQAQERENAIILYELKTAKADNSDLRAELANLREQLSALQKYRTESDGLKVKHAEQRVADHIHIVDLLLRNSAIRKTVHGQQVVECGSDRYVDTKPVEEETTEEKV